MLIGAMNHPARDPVEEVRWIGENGFDFVDLTLEPPAADPEVLDVGAVRSELDRWGLEVVAHTAWYLPLGSPFSGVREAVLEEFRRCLRTTSELGATIMNAHYRRLPRFFSDEQAVEWHVETLAPLCDEAARLGVAIVLEHAPKAGGHQLENFVAIMERIPLLRFHLDSGHARLERAYDRFDEYLEQLGHRLAHIHLSENDGTGDQHLPLGSVPRSPDDWPERIRKLKATGYDGTITLEVFSGAREHLSLSRDLLRKWWDGA